MIRLIDGENTVALTLTEKVKISNPVFLFQFQNKQDKKFHYCIAEDTSLYPDRYNKFTITVKETPDPLSGELSLSIGSEYEYTIYQQSSGTNLDPAEADGIVEVGYMIYEKEMTERSSYENVNTERPVYVRQ